ncbi:hypothetical protein EYF80_041257 [Liparis tanakae]|uniref:Uncharacterized protein n=1 Tax=Liparis tanakae TaxID=230148 RepID=A0A4Z2G5P3_9TELE|nr:hypothetical protein EYF80_041257 [Liparis tanakae]
MQLAAVLWGSLITLLLSQSPGPVALKDGISCHSYPVVWGEGGWGDPGGMASPHGCMYYLSERRV